jgi:periplasmic protein TonB
MVLADGAFSSGKNAKWPGAARGHVASRLNPVQVASVVHLYNGPGPVEVNMAVTTVEKRSLGALSRVGIVAAMHAGALLLFARSFGLVSGDTMPPTIEASVIQQQKIDDPPPPTPDYVPQPDNFARIPEPVPIPLPDSLAESSITAELAPLDEIPLESGSAEPLPVVVGVRSDSRFPPSQPPYPPEMIRRGQEGVVDVQVYVNPNGRVAEARIFKSSGFSAFDRSTLEEARRKWRFQPATRDGVPIAQWHRLRVVFELKDQ